MCCAHDEVFVRSFFLLNFFAWIFICVKPVTDEHFYCWSRSCLHCSSKSFFLSPATATSRSRTTQGWFWAAGKKDEGRMSYRIIRFLWLNMSIGNDRGVLFRVILSRDKNSVDIHKSLGHNHLNLMKPTALPISHSGPIEERCVGM